MPSGTTPPLVINYNASTVPILQIGLSGEGLTEQNLGDLGINQVRTPLITVPGAAIHTHSAASSGKYRSTSIPLRCSPSVFPPTTSRTHSPHRT